MALLVAACALAVAGLLPLFLSTSAIDSLIQEGGLVEDVTIVLYGLALLALGLHRSAVSDRRSWLAVLVVVTALCARELDLHLAWTDYSVLKVSFYLGDAPVRQKLAALAAVSAFLVAVVYLACKHGREMPRSVRKRDPLAVTVAMFIAMLVLSKLLDRAVGLLMRDAGVAMSYATQVWFVVTEEMLELGLPVLVLVGWLQHRRTRP